MPSGPKVAISESVTLLQESCAATFTAACSNSLPTEITLEVDAYHGIWVSGELEFRNEGQTTAMITVGVPYEMVTEDSSCAGNGELILAPGDACVIRWYQCYSAYTWRAQAEHQVRVNDGDMYPLKRLGPDSSAFQVDVRSCAVSDLSDTYSVEYNDWSPLLNLRYEDKSAPPKYCADWSPPILFVKHLWRRYSIHDLRIPSYEAHSDDSWRTP